MALTFTSAALPGSGAVDLRRVVVALVVVAAHVALIFVMGKGGRRTDAEVVEITWVPLPITPEAEAEEPSSQPITPPESPVPPAAAVRSRTGSSARSRKSSPDEESQQKQSNETKPENEVAPNVGEPVESAPVDWFAEARTTAEALDARGKAERERRSLAGPARDAMKTPRAQPPCPFEKCEPGWGTGFSVFPPSKAGRIEKTFDDEVIRWTSNHCYQILITPNPMHRAMTKCVLPLEKSAARGDLFKHMKEAPPPPEDRATDVP